MMDRGKDDRHSSALGYSAISLPSLLSCIKNKNKHIHSEPKEFPIGIGKLGLQPVIISMWKSSSVRDSFSHIVGGRRLAAD